MSSAANIQISVTRFLGKTGSPPDFEVVFESDFGSLNTGRVNRQQAAEIREELQSALEAIDSLLT